MDSLDKAKNLLATQYSNVFILIEDADGCLFWAGSELFGEGACRKFLRSATGDLEIIYESDEDDED